MSLLQQNPSIPVKNASFCVLFQRIFFVYLM